MCNVIALLITHLCYTTCKNIILYFTECVLLKNIWEPCNIMKKIRGSALPTVLVVSVLISLLILGAFQLLDMNTFYYSRYHFIKQQKLHLISALDVVCNDSLSYENAVIEGKLQLYEDDLHSNIYMEHYPWGLYECICLSTFDRSLKNVYLVGKAKDIDCMPALWLCERENTFSLSGEAEIVGNLYLPRNGISYVQFDLGKYRGELISSSLIHTSDKELPSMDSTFLKTMEEMKEVVPAFLSEIPNQYYSFQNEPIYAVIPEKTRESFYAKGRLVLYGDRVIIPATWELSDILLIAKHVTVESGFSGSMQIMASDTVVMEEGAYLHYPSGVYLNGNNDKTYFHICKDARLEGYAVIKGDIENGSGFVVDIHSRLDKGSILTGLLYVDGIAHIEGTVSGCAYLKECYYLSGEYMYAGLIHDGKIIRNNDIGFPFLFKESGYRKRKMKMVE